MVFNKLALSTILLVFSTLCGRSQAPFQSFVDKWNKHEYFENATVGVAVHEISTQAYSGGINRNKSLVPASSMKVITTFTLHDLLGNDFKYKTVIAYDGKVEEGVLSGDLHIIGSGDPSLGSDRFEGYPTYKELMPIILNKLKAKGITEIDGKIIVDESVFDSSPIAPSWQWNDLGNYYGAGAWGLNINENEYNIFFNTRRKIGTKALLWYTEPMIPGLEIFNEVTVDSAGTGDNSYVFGGPYVYQKRAVGKLPYSTTPFKIKGSIPDPPKYMAYSLYKYFTDNGLASDGYKVNYSNTRGLTYIDTILSPNLIDILEQANHKSINQYCEAFLKTIGHQKYGLGSTENGVKYVNEYLKTLNIDTKALKMKDGCGLSARNYISVEILSKFLAAHGQKYGIEHLQKMLPQAGVEGTVRGVLSGSYLSKYVWMKSGSMEGIISYTGMVKAKSGKWMTFSVIINAYSEPYRNIRSRIENLIEGIYINN